VPDSVDLGCGLTTRQRLFSLAGGDDSGELLNHTRMGRQNPADHAFEPTLQINHCASVQFDQEQRVGLWPKISARKCHAFEWERLRGSKQAEMGWRRREAQFYKAF